MNPKVFATAGGLISVNRKAQIKIGGIDEILTPWIADNCPELISVGQRISKGYSFIWAKDNKPYFIGPDNKILELQVHNNIPFTRDNGTRKEPSVTEARIIEAINNNTQNKIDIIAPAIDAEEQEDDPEENNDSDDVEEPALSPAQRVEHLLTHLPKRRDCDTCQRAKMRSRCRYRNTYNPQTTNWGDLVSADHLKGNGLDFALGDEAGALIIKDAYSGLVGYYGVKDQTWETTHWAIREFKGERNIQLFYSDGAPEIARAVRTLGILHRTSTPGVPQNNGVIEREVQECIRGLRTLLLAAGLPTAFWVYAAEAFGFMKNIMEKEDGESAWEKTHGSKFTGLRIPFGSKVYFIPSPTKNVESAKMEPSAHVGIFAGYALAPGYTWTGDYLVWLLDDFMDINLHRNATINKHKLVRPHRIRNVEIPVGPISFPLKDKYEICNTHLSADSSAAGLQNTYDNNDKWNNQGIWWIRNNKMPRKYRYRPCLEPGGPEIDSLSPWRMTIKLGKDGCAETFVDEWNTGQDIEEEQWTGLTIFNAHPTGMEITHKTTVGRKQNYSKSGTRIAEAYDSRANTTDFDRRDIENKPWDGESPPVPLDGTPASDFFRGEDGIWRIRSAGRAWKVDRNGERWTIARLRENKDTKRPADVSVKNWHTKLSKTQKKSFNKRRKVSKSISRSPGGESDNDEIKSEGNGGVDIEIDNDNVRNGGVEQENNKKENTQHFDISTPINSPRNKEEDSNKTPVPTPRENTDMDGISENQREDAPITNKRRKINMDNELNGQPGSSNDHLINTTGNNDDEMEHESISSMNSDGDSDSSSSSSSSGSTSSSSEEKGESNNTDDNNKNNHRDKQYRNASIFAQIFVARPVSHKERREQPKAQAAMQKEWDNLRNKGCWDENNPREWNQLRKEARLQGKTIHIGRLVPICVEKNSELPIDDPARKYKGRVVFQGNMVKDQDYEDAEFENLGSSPATMEASKSADAYGCIEGNHIEIADAEQAYIQADMKGKDTWIQIPEEDQPKWWKEKYPYMKKPVVKMMKALYGHPDAGSYWEQKADEQAKKVGFREIEDWPSTYYHRELKLMLIIYVDDFKISGPSENIEKGWELLRQGIKIGEPEKIDEKGTTYLGCKQRRVISRDKGGKYKAVMEYDMKDFVQSCIDRYVEMAEVGTEPRHYTTPMLSESNTPMTGNNEKCPWCEKPDKKYNKCDIKGITDSEYDGYIGKSFKGRAGKMVMKLLWVARICRYDIIKAVTHLASFLTKWETIHDIKLKRLIGYLTRTKEYCLYGWIGDKMENLNPTLYADSDFAGCVVTRKSTSGMVHQLTGPNSCFPLMASSKKQNCISHSTAEAELIATCTAVKTVGLPSLILWEEILRRKVKAKLFEDNIAMIKMLKHGLSPSMRYISRTHGVSLAAMKEIIDKKEIEIEYIKSKLMKADILTKGFSSMATWDEARRHIQVGSNKEYV